MSLKQQILDQTDIYITSKYTINEGYTIPFKPNVTFGAQAKKLKHAVAVYVDIRGSRKILSKYGPIETARAHKAFIYAVSKCLKSEDGHVRSFNGDSILCFFSGENSSIRAVRAAMKAVYAVRNFVNPKLVDNFQEGLDFGIGISQGEITVVKSGLPREEITQDLIWLGWPTYIAYEYGNITRSPNNIMISHTVYAAITKEEKLIYTNGQYMWETGNITLKSGTRSYYSTNYGWVI